MKSVLALFSLLALAVLSSCVTDAGYRQLQAKAETNPNPKVIVGMWHHKWSGDFGSHHQVTVLVRADGTGLQSHHVENWTDGKSEILMPFNWRYEGKGIWKMNFYEHGLVWTTMYSGGKLIRFTDDYNSLGALGRVSEIFERVKN